MYAIVWVEYDRQFGYKYSSIDGDYYYYYYYYY